MARNSRYHVADGLEWLRRDYGVSAQQVAGSEFNRVCKLWLETFCPNVKRNTGNWVFNRFRWHAYSFGHEIAQTGVRAFETYSDKSLESFYIYLETRDLLFDCRAKAWPDFRTLTQDIYVFPHSMAWTFVTTHEASLNLGPYFAEPPDRAASG